jgi:hypothetical protein
MARKRDQKPALKIAYGLKQQSRAMCQMDVAIKGLSLFLTLMKILRTNGAITERAFPANCRRTNMHRFTNFTLDRVDTEHH